MGIPEAEAQRIEAGRTRTFDLSKQGQLLASVRARTDRRGLPRRHLVSLMHADRTGTDHPGTFDQR